MQQKKKKKKKREGFTRLTGISLSLKTDTKSSITAKAI